MDAESDASASILPQFGLTSVHVNLPQLHSKDIAGGIERQGKTKKDKAIKAMMIIKYHKITGVYLEREIIYCESCHAAEVRIVSRPFEESLTRRNSSFPSS